MKSKIAFILLLCVAGLPILAQTGGPETSMVSPYYFGPNAFPVPDMLDGTVQPDLRIELDGNHYFGTRGDHTTDLTLKVNIPLFTDRVNLSAWMPLLVGECASRVNNLLMHQPIEPGTKEAFEAYVSCLHQLYLMGAAVQLRRMGYHMTEN